MEKRKPKGKSRSALDNIASKLSPRSRVILGLRRGLRNPSLEKIIRATNRASGKFNHAPDSFDTSSMLKEDPGIYTKAARVDRLLKIERKKARARLFKNPSGMPHNYKDR